MTDSFARLVAALADRYRIERELGAGGMATVYLAEDLKHDRRVAIKVLKPELAAVVGAERFLVEIRTTAKLQHPGILPLHDSGEADSFLYYVMPYVEGESLRDRLDREHQLPVDEAVKIAGDVAEALEYAHGHGVVHRDVKPANIVLVAGRPVILDFGIALAVGVAGGGRLTETGLSLGTPQYMSPEQATGDAHVGPATDIYALGCVLYEMLTGDPPHVGSTAQAVLARIITEPPVPITKQRKSVPPNVEATVARALEKLPADRFRSAGDFAKALVEPRFRYGGPGAAAGGVGLTAGDARRWNRVSFAVATVAGLLAVGLTATLVVLLPRVGAGRRPSGQIRFTVSLPTDSGVYLGGAVDATFGRPSTTDIVLSPDGSLLVYAGWRADADGKVTSQLYRRPLGQEHTDPIPGTDGASSPIFSPDGQWIGFFSGGALKRVPPAGGSAQIVTPDAHVGAAMVLGASWSDDGTIAYGANGDADGIYQVAAEGGEPELILANQPDSAGVQRASTPPSAYAYPSTLPGGRTLLVEDWPGFHPDSANVVAIDLVSGKRTTLLSDAMDPRFVPPDHLLFARHGTLMEVGFDARRLRIVGQPLVVLEDVMQAVTTPNAGWDTGASQVAISRSGDMAWVDGGTYPEPPNAVVEIPPDGRGKALDWESRKYSHMRVSPQGDRVAYAAGPGNHRNIYVRDLARGVTSRLNVGGYDNVVGAWSPDGTSLLISSDRDGPAKLYRIAADGSGKPMELAPSDEDQGVGSWSSQGVIAYLRWSHDGPADIWTLAPDGKPTAFVATDADEELPEFSPDGRWLAYVSDASGREEVYVRAYPGPGAAIQVSANGGASPAWSPDGRRLYYIQGRTTSPAMMVTEVLSLAPLRIGRARPLIDPWPYQTSIGRSYDVLPDGSFIAPKLLGPVGLRAGSREALRQMFRVGAVHVILNFAAGPRGKAP